MIITTSYDQLDELNEHFFSNTLEDEIIEEVDLNKIDYEQLLSYNLDKRTIKIKAKE